MSFVLPNKCFFIKSTCWLVVLSVECGCIKMILIEGTVRDIEWIKCRLFYNLFKWTKHWTSNKHIKMENSILYDILSIVKLVTMFVMQCTYVLKYQTNYYSWLFLLRKKCVSVIKSEIKDFEFYQNWTKPVKCEWKLLIVFLYQNWK